jgi:hypothetical protein
MRVVRRYIDGDELGFAEIDLEPGTLSVSLYNRLHSSELLNVSGQNHDRVVGVLDDRKVLTGRLGNGKTKNTLLDRFIHCILQQVTHRDKEQGGQGVALTHTSLADELCAWNTIKENR